MSSDTFSFNCAWKIDHTVILPNTVTDKLLGKGHGLHDISIIVPFNITTTVTVDSDDKDNAEKLIIEKPHDFIKEDDFSVSGDIDIQEPKYNVNFILGHPNIQSFKAHVVSQATSELLNSDNSEQFNKPVINA